MADIFVSGINRVDHFCRSLLWFKTQMEENVTWRNQFEKLVDTLSKPSGSHFLAIGKSAQVAKLCSGMFASIGHSLFLLHPSDALHGDLGMVNFKDHVLCISKSGGSREILESIPHLLARECAITAITANPESALANLAHHVLLLPPTAEYCELNEAPVTSSLTTTALCQLLFSAVVEKYPVSLDVYARNHPGGNIGQKIFLKVHHLMIPQEKLPVVSVETPFPECISLMTSAAIGALLVTMDNKLKGIISEKDLRVAMNNFGPDVFHCTAKQLMNGNPVTIEPELSAFAAASQMKTPTRILNVLPVVDSNTQTLCGLLRLHDMITHGFMTHPEE